MPDLFEITEQDVIKEIETELGYRARVYPRLVARKVMSQDRADWRNACLRKGLEWIKERTDDKKP